MRRVLLGAVAGWFAGAISMILWRAHLDGPMAPDSGTAIHCAKCSQGQYFTSDRTVCECHCHHPMTCANCGKPIQEVIVGSGHWAHANYFAFCYPDKVATPIQPIQPTQKGELTP